MTRLAYLSSTLSELSLSKRCQLLSINRSRVYYQAVAASEEEIRLQHKVYNIWEERNNKGSRMITADLREYEGLEINRKKVQRIMRELGIAGILPRRNLSVSGELQHKHPYYLSGMNVYKSNMVWGTDLTYCKLPAGMMYVISLLDIYSRYVVAYVITNTLDISGCIECFNEAVAKHGRPYMLNSDQGSQFTSKEWVNTLQSHDIVISMDSKGRWSDNVYVERFWRTLKYECIFAQGVETVGELHLEVDKYIEYYNNRRLHSSLEYKTPASVYNNSHMMSESAVYCTYPAEKDRIRTVKKRVLPTVRQRETEQKNGNIINGGRL